MSSILGREAFNKPGFRTETVELPLRGGSLIVREMTSGDALTLSEGVKNGTLQPALWLAHKCVIDQAGAKVFSSPEDAGECLSRDELATINAAIMRVNGMDGETEKKSDAPSDAG
jgi:hypothetical protein